MKIFSSIAVASMLICSTAFSASQFSSTTGNPVEQKTGIGTVDLTQILNTPAFSEKQKSIAEKYKAEADALQQTAKDLKKDMDELAANKGKWPADKVKKAEADLDKRRSDFAQKNAQLSQKQINEFQSLSNEFINAVKAATASVAEERKLSLVISESDATTLYASKALDITKSVIDKVKF